MGKYIYKSVPTTIVPTWSWLWMYFCLQNIWGLVVITVLNKIVSDVMDEIIYYSHALYHLFLRGGADYVLIPVRGPGLCIVNWQSANEPISVSEEQYNRCTVPSSWSRFCVWILCLLNDEWHELGLEPSLLSENRLKMYAGNEVTLFSNN